MTDTTGGRIGTSAGREEDVAWPGLPHLAEETAELGRLISEITASGGRSAVQREQLIARLGALRAAIDFTVARNGLNWEAVNRSRDRQRARYESLDGQASQPPAA